MSNKIPSIDAVMQAIDQRLGYTTNLQPSEVKEEKTSSKNDQSPNKSTKTKASANSQASSSKQQEKGKTKKNTKKSGNQANKNQDNKKTKLATPKSKKGDEEKKANKSQQGNKISASKIQTNNPNQIKDLPAPKLKEQPNVIDPSIVKTKGTPSNNDQQSIHKVFCCGKNTSHELRPMCELHGIPSELYFNLKGLVSVQSGLDFSVALYNNGKVFGLGRNSSQQIFPSELKQFIEPKEIDIGEPISQIECGKTYTAYLTTSGTIIASTSFGLKRLKVDSKIMSIFGGEVTLVFITSNKSLYAIQLSIQDSKPMLLAENSGIIGAAVLKKRVFVWDINGKTYVLNFTREVAPVDSLEGICVTTIKSGFSHIVALSNEGKVYSMGNNTCGQLGISEDVPNVDRFVEVTALYDIIEIAVSSKHTLFLRKDGTVFVCGSNSDGQILLKEAKEKNFLTEIKLPLPISKIYAGGDHSFFIVNGLELKEPSNTQKQIVSNTTKSSETNNPKQATSDQHNEVLIMKQAANLPPPKQTTNLPPPKQTAVLSQTSHQTASRRDSSADKDALKNYKMIREVSVGRFGKGYEFFNEITGKQVYMKYMNQVAMMPKMSDFYSIMKHLVSLHHPCLVKHEHFYAPANDERTKLSMEFLNNKTLQEYLNEEVSPTRKAIIIMQIALGMDFLHKNEILHGNLKPTNILVTKSHDIKITDYLDTTLEGFKFTKANRSGTVTYLAPELINKTEFNSSVDVYAFGFMLYQVVTGTLPEISENEICNGCRPSIPDKVLNNIGKLICACWSHDPSKRPTFEIILKILKEYKYMIMPEVDGKIVSDVRNLIEFLAVVEE